MRLSVGLRDSFFHLNSLMNRRMPRSLYNRHLPHHDGRCANRGPPGSGHIGVGGCQPAPPEIVGYGRWARSRAAQLRPPFVQADTIWRPVVGWQPRARTKMVHCNHSTGVISTVVTFIPGHELRVRQNYADDYVLHPSPKSRFQSPVTKVPKSLHGRLFFQRANTGNV